MNLWLVMGIFFAALSGLKTHQHESTFPGCKLSIWNEESDQKKLLLCFNTWAASVITRPHCVPTIDPQLTSSLKCYHSHCCAGINPIKTIFPSMLQLVTMCDMKNTGPLPTSHSNEGCWDLLDWISEDMQMWEQEYLHDHYFLWQHQGAKITRAENHISNINTLSLFIVIQVRTWTQISWWAVLVCVVEVISL